MLRTTSPRGAARSSVRPVVGAGGEATARPASRSNCTTETAHRRRPALVVGGQAHGPAAARPVEPWSAERPRLYEAVLSAQRAATVPWPRWSPYRVGFRHIERRDGRFFFNGAPITLRGINRHEFHPEYGRAVPLSSVEFDVLEMKRHNVNAVRTAHYPPDSRFLDLCDIHGLYVIDEADLECHGFIRAGDQNRFSNDPSWLPTILTGSSGWWPGTVTTPASCSGRWATNRVAGKPRRHGPAGREIDPTRLIHYERCPGAEMADVYGSMYTHPDDLGRTRPAGRAGQAPPAERVRPCHGQWPGSLRSIGK